MKERMTKSRLLLILLISAGILLPAGCGKKGPPVPPSQILTAPVNDLKARVVNGNMTLYWTIPLDSENVTVPLEGYYVFQAEEEVSEGMCEECPRRYTIIGEPLIYSASEKENGQQIMTYIKQLRKGFRYTYKVRGFTGGGSIGGDSNIIEFVYGADSEQNGQEQ